jgi:tetratricopeptide (TPR) repeat protein
LLRFLDGELDAIADASVLAHVQDCAGCQEQLERLTEGHVTAEGQQAIDTVRTDREPMADLHATEELATEGQDEDRPAKPGECQSTDPGRPGAGLIWESPPISTANMGASPPPGQGSTEEPDADGATDDPDRTIAPSRADGDTQPVSARLARPDWPSVPGYEILERLGEGGMGVVYKARHLGLNRMVALKMIRGGGHARADYLSRFHVEAQAVARLRHLNILQIYDIGEARGLPYVALELLEGGGLDDRLGGTPQPGGQAADLMATLARAVHVAHEAGIVHRDLKPSNVLYTSDGVPKIADFGLAKRIDSDTGQTESGQIVGSPSYMAPEQAKGQSRKVGPPADVYALGAILYEMLTGRPPFKGETPMETVRQVIDDDPVAPSKLVPKVARDLETVCLKCLHKEPARRYESAALLADDLTHFLRGEPIRARRTPVWERAGKWARRRPLAAASWIAVVLATFGAVAVLFAYQRSLLEGSQKLLAAQTTGNSLQQEADAARSEAELERAQQHLSDFLPDLRALQDAPQIKVLSDLLIARRHDVSRRLAILRSQRGERDRAHAERTAFQKFRALWTEALFHDTQITGLPLASNRDATRRIAREALDLYAATPGSDAWAPGPPPSSLLEAERAEIADGCYALLLVLAAAEARPELGLQRLDQAAKLHRPTRAYHLRRAAYLARAGEAAGAKRERSEADRLQPDTAFDHFLVGQERYEHQDLVGAAQAFDAALQIKPDDFWAHCLSAVCWLRLNQPIEAKASLNACLQRERQFAWLYLLRGLASSQVAGITYRLMEREKEKEKRSGPTPSPDPVDRQFEVADSDYRRASLLLDRTPNDDLRYALFVNRGVLRLDLHRDLDEAVKQLQSAIGIRSRGVEAHVALAKVYQLQDKPDLAIEQFGRAIALRPHSPDLAALYRDRAAVNLARRDPSAAERANALSDLDQAIRLEKPGNRVVVLDQTNRARLLFADHREAEALAACDAALKIDPNRADALRLRIDVLLALGRFDEIIRSCDALMAGGKVSAQVARLRGLARGALKDYAGAIEDATLALALSAEKARLLVWRGGLHILAQAPTLALRDFEHAIQLDSSNGDAYTGRGLARARLLGQASEAVADAEKALGLGELEPHLLYNAARIYAMAAVVASTEARKKGHEAVVLVDRYQDRAVMLLREALRRLPANQREAFWRDSIQADPALRALRRRVAAPEPAGPAP